MDGQTRKALELLIELAEERRIHETERPDSELARRIADAIAQVRGFVAALGDAAS